MFVLVCVCVCRVCLQIFLSGVFFSRMAVDGVTRIAFLRNESERAKERRSERLFFALKLTFFVVAKMVKSTIASTLACATLQK